MSAIANDDEMTQADADRLYAWVQRMNDDQLHALWKWLFLELVTRWRRRYG